MLMVDIGKDQKHVGHGPTYPNLRNQLVGVIFNQAGSYSSMLISL